MSYHLKKSYENALINWCNNNCGGGVNEIQKFSFDVVPVAGEWKITYNDTESTSLTASAVTTDIKAALEAFTSINTVNVAGTYTAGFTCEITDPAKSYLSQMYIQTNTTTAIITVEMVQEGVPDITFHMAYENGLEPSTPYGFINVTSAGNLDSRPARSYKGLDTFTHHFHENMSLSINIYCKDGHMQKAEKLKRSIYFDSVRQDLVSAGLYFTSFSDVRDLSELVDTQFEKRSQFDAFFGYGEDVDETLTEIQTIEGEFTTNTKDFLFNT